MYTGFRAETVGFEPTCRLQAAKRFRVALVMATSIRLHMFYIIKSR